MSSKVELKTIRLDFVPSDEIVDVDAGRYWIMSLDKGEWAARFIPLNAGDDHIEINAVAESAGGEEFERDWPSRDCAAEICGAHARLMSDGQTAENAAKLILEFSREYLLERAERRARAEAESGCATH